MLSAITASFVAAYATWWSGQILERIVDGDWPSSHALWWAFVILYFVFCLPIAIVLYIFNVRRLGYCLITGISAAFTVNTFLNFGWIAAMLDQCADHSETCPTAPAWLLTAMIQPRVVLYSVFVGAAGGAAFWWIGRLQDDPKNSRLFPLKSKLPKSLVS